MILRGIEVDCFTYIRMIFGDDSSEVLANLLISSVFTLR